MKVYEYIIRFKDHASDKISRFNAVTSTARSNVRNFDSSVRTASRTTSMFGGIASTAARFIGPLVLGAALLGGAKKASALAAEMEQTRTTFEVMLASTKKADKLTMALTEMANVTPFTKRNLMDSAKLLLNFGVAESKILPNLQMLGDISGGNAYKLHLMTLAFSQMTAAGRLMGQDLLQMINAGFNPLQEISRKTGISIGVLKKQMEKGAISSQMVTDAFRSATSEGGRFFGLMDKQSMKFSGRVSTLRDKVELLMEHVGDSLNEKLRPAVDASIEVLDSLIDPVAKATREFNLQKNIVDKLEKEAKPLIARYEELTSKSKLNKKEQKELKTATEKLSDLLPGAATRWNAYGKAIEFNTDRLRALVSENKEALKILNADAIKETRFEFAKRTIEANDLLFDIQHKLKGAERAAAEAKLQGLIGPGGIIEGLNNKVRELQGLDPQSIKLAESVGSRLTKIGQPGLFAKMLGDVRAVTDFFSFIDKPPPKEPGGNDDTAGGSYDSLKDGIDNITGGGKRAVNVTINLDNLVGVQHFDVKNLKETARNIEDEMIELMLRVVNSANQAASQ